MQMKPGWRWWLGLACLCVMTSVASGWDEPAREPAPEVRVVDRPTIRAMLARGNEMRISRGLPAHRLSHPLTRAAQDHADYMARTGTFSHYSNGGPGGRAGRYGYRAGCLENIAYGTGTVPATFTMWRNSGGHYANLMSRTSEAGYGYAVSRFGTPYWVAVYGTSDGTPEDVPPVEPKPVSPPSEKPAAETSPDKPGEPEPVPSGEPEGSRSSGRFGPLRAIGRLFGRG